MRPFSTALCLSAAATLALGGAALAAPAKPAARAAAAKPVTPPVWTVDKANSRIRFKSAFSGAAFEGQFSRWDAQISFDPKNLAASKAVVNVDVASAQTGDKDRDETLPTGDWFNAPKFPRATFTTTSIKSLGGDRYQAQGNLSLKGVTKPVTLPFTLKITGNTAKMDGQTVINRSQFGVGQGQFGGAETVPFDVTVTVSLTAKKG
jgi:polyisoprenoid-binding protein YceI